MSKLYDYNGKPFGTTVLKGFAKFKALLSTFDYTAARSAEAYYVPRIRIESNAFDHEYIEKYLKPAIMDLILYAGTYGYAFEIDYMYVDTYTNYPEAVERSITIPGVTDTKDPLYPENGYESGKPLRINQFLQGIGVVAPSDSNIAFNRLHMFGMASNATYRLGSEMQEYADQFACVTVNVRLTPRMKDMDTVLFEFPDGYHCAVVGPYYSFVCNRFSPCQVFEDSPEGYAYPSAMYEVSFYYADRTSKPSFDVEELTDRFFGYYKTNIQPYLAKEVA